MDYRTIDKENQSLLKEILKSPQAYRRAKEKYENPEDVIPAHFVFGSAVDHLTTEDTPIENNFYIMGESAISDTIKKIVDHVHEEIAGWKDKLEDCSEAIVRSCSFEQYGQAWKEDTRIKKVVETGSGYYADLLACAGKTIISQEDYTKAVNCNNALRNDDFTGQYFNPGENQQLLKKVVIQFTYHDVEMKCELDLVFIDHDTKQIYPIDIKTIGTSVYAFKGSFWKYRYDFQAAVYFYACLGEYYELLEKGYKLMPFRFLVVEKENYNPPLIFTTSEEILNIGMNGGTNSDCKYYEGFEQAIDRYKYHIENNTWDYPMEYLENQGQIIISV